MRRLLIFAGLIWCPFAFGQIQITGTVVDEQQQPLSYADVLLFRSGDSTLVKGFIADHEGAFLAEAGPGAYRLEVSFLGYRRQRLEVSQSGDLGIIQLQPDSENLEGITVTAEKPFIQKESDKLVVNVEGSIVAAGNSTLGILGMSPGVIVDQDDNISLNGRNGVRIFVDGKDTRLQGQELSNLLRSMPSSSIEKIELITNPSARYEAQGNAGIINIVTKKGKFYGTNGSVTLTPGLGRYFRWENNLSLNHRTERFNIYGQYSLAKRSQWMKIDINRRFVDEADNTLASYELRNLFELPIETHNPRLGVDFQAGEHTTMGVLVTALFNSNGSLATNDIRQFDAQGGLVSTQQTDTDVDSQWNQVTGNFNVNHQFTKSNVDLDFDVARYTNTSDQRYDSGFTNPDGTAGTRNLLTGLVDGYLNLAGLTLDYELEVSDSESFEAGWKNTWVKSDNDLEYFDTVDGTTTPNEQLTNRFIYDENIYGAYASYRLHRARWNGQLGLRGEYTEIQGNQVTTDSIFQNNYLKLFPSASFNYNLNEKNVLGLSVSRRIDRPGYSQLNPFRFFVDTNTFRVGNPLLSPQFTWLGEVNYTLNGKYYLALSYGYTTDNLSFGIIQDGDNQAVLVQPFNVETVRSYSLTASLPITVAKWWRSNWNLNASYNEFDGLVNGSELNRSTPIVSLSTNHSFDLGKEFRLQLNTFNLFPHYVSITRIEELSSVSIGLQKTVMDGKGTLRLNVNDIFFNQYPVGYTDFAGIDDGFRSYRDTRYAALSFTWRFGKQSVEPAKRRQSGVQEELERARQQNNS